MAALDPSRNPEQVGDGPSLALIEHCRRIGRSLPFRSAVVAVKLMLVFVMSQKDAAFFYQQF